MERKKFMIKNVFYIIFAFMLAGVGFLFFPKPEAASALNISSVEPLGNQSLKARPFFLREDFVIDEDTSAEQKEQAYGDSLISSDTFLYSAQAKNSLRLSFDYNGIENEQYNDQEIFNYVFYPNLSNRATFLFFANINPTLKINGKTIDISSQGKKFVDPTEYMFPNANPNDHEQSADPHIEIFEMVFDAEGEGEHSISLFDGENFVEGVYELSIEYTIFSTTNGTNSLETITFENQSFTETYSFYVTNRGDYLTNNRPNMKNASFDHAISLESDLQPDAYLLYSNFSSKSTSSTAAGDLASEKNKIPYIEYDYWRFEADITKELSNVLSSASLRLNTDQLNGQEEDAVVPGDDSDASIVKTKIDTINHTIKVFFTDVGVYNIVLKPILVVEYGQDQSTVWQKYELNGVASEIKTSKVHMFGYQLFYTDFDSEADQNNVRPIKEMKDFDLTTETFVDGADVTSEFLYANSYYQLGDNSSSFFTPQNIFSFINKTETDGSFAYSPVKTNQTPLSFLANATLLSGNGSQFSGVESTIYTTANIDTFTKVNTAKLQGETMYQGTFDGLTQNTPGKYVYVLRYNYSNFNLNESTTGGTQLFKQIFFFEIDKNVPEIEIVAENGKTVSKNMFLNQSVFITDTTNLNKYNKDVTIQVYGWDYAAGTNGQWLSGYTSRGLSFDDLTSFEGDNDSRRTLPKTANGRYTVRLYYTNEIKNHPEKLDYDTGTGYFRQITFTIDTNPIEGIKARNFQQINGTSKYFFHSDIADDNFSTNQPIAFSWNKKLSGAKMWAYYRYFPLQNGLLGQYYSSTNEEKVEELLTYMVNNETLPVNSILDLRTSVDKTDGSNEKEYRNWLPYAGNTLELDENNLDKQYVLSDAGLYFLDVYDAAGNHKLDVFMIDNTAPIFAIHDDNGYSIPTSPFINSKTTLYWGKYKAIYISGLNENLYTGQDYETTHPSISDLTDEIYKTHDGKASTEIYELIRQKLFDKKRIQNLKPTINADSSADNVSSLISNYDGLYVTIEIENTSYYMEGVSYQKQDGVFSHEFDAKAEITYTVLIRDKSNTKKYTQWNDDAEQQFTSYYSAKQTIIVSFDTSRFFIQYQTNDQTTEYITSNNVEKPDDETLVTYLNPTRLNKPLELTFRPTDSSNDKIQVESVTITYYEFKAMSKLVPDPADEPDTEGNTIARTKYWYYAFDDAKNEPQKLYTFEDEGDTQTRTIQIRPNEDNVTAPGKYVITRTYKTDNGFMHNAEDYTTRTYVLIVDRNDVISNQRLVDDASGKNHNEDLVGGDIFVAMYDSGSNYDLVVTFPNSEKSNTNGALLYSNNLNTNELPVKLYVPQFKYTTYVEKARLSNGYEFDVKYDFDSEQVVVEGDTTKLDLDTMNYYQFKEKNLIREYALYAEIYKDVNPAISSATPIAVTCTTPKQPTLDTVKAAADGHGFLKFFNYNSSDEYKIMYQPGTYYVRIYQGMFGTGTDENLYTKTFDFNFVIENTTPNFEVTTTNGQTLNNTPASNNAPLTYYTNQSKLNITWEKSRNEFMADIDVTQIKFSTRNNMGVGEDFSYNLEQNSYSRTHQNIWDTMPKENNNIYSGILDLQTLLGVYQNGGHVDITMQYKNHDVAKDENGNNLYSTITKRIYIDLCAPSNNVESLVNKALQDTPASMGELFNHSALRTYLTANNNTVTTDLQNTSYNISNGTDQNIFAYYSYSVTKDFIRDLNASEEDATAYVKPFKVGDINTKYTTDKRETSPSEFNPNDFTLVTTMQELDSNTYYEVVEIDRAGNMAIYTIFVSDLDANQNLITYVDEDNNEKAYTTEDYKRALAYPNAIHNIFARTGFELRGINFFGDEWARLRLTTYSRGEDGNVTSNITNLMLTPYDKNYAYIFAGNGSPAQKIAISSLIDGKQSLAQKHKLEIFDRLNGTQTAFYFNIYNTPLTPMPTSTSSQELLSFQYVSDDKIHNTTLSQDAFVIGMKITVDGRAIYSDGVNADNVPLQVKNPLGYASLWKNFVQNPSQTWQSDELVRVYVRDNQLCFEVNPNYSSVSRNSRVVYEFTDNYGVTYTETHIFRETVISKEVSSADETRNPLYAYFDNAAVRLNYIIKDGLQYNFNANKYHVEYYEIATNEQGTSRIQPLHMYRDDPTFNGGITTWTFHTNRSQAEQYRDNFVLVLYDQLEYEESANGIEGISPKKEIYFTLYDQLPRENLNISEANKPGQFQLRDVNNNLIPSSTLVDGTQGYYSQVRVTFNPLNENEAFIPVKFMYRTEDSDWKELTSGTRLQNTSGGLEKYYLKIWYDEQYLHNELGNGAYVFEKVPESQIFQFSLSTLTSNYWVEKTIDGETTIVEKAEHSFRSPDPGSTYQCSNHYIVNAAVGNVKIKVNNEQKITGYESPERTWRYTVNEQLIVSERYFLTNRNSINYEVPVFETTVVITYIPNEQNFLSSFFTLDTNGTINTNENMVNDLRTAEKMLVVTKDVDMDRTQIIWSKYFVIPENEIDIKIKLSGKEIEPVVYTKTVENEECKYIYLTYSGLYSIQFVDTAGNIQRFANKDSNGNLINYEDTFEFIFLKDVPFTVTYTNPETGEIETGLPVKQAVYNDYVTLKIDPATLTRFYRSDGYPSFLDTEEDPETGTRKYLVKRNGEVYQKEFESSTEFTFDQPGFYEIAFASVSNLPNVGSIRQETYQFTIINQNEYKVSHVFNKYANYYIEKIEKKNVTSFVDITQALLETLDVDTVIVGKTTYMTQLPLSYLDEKTGAGEYLITINTNNRLYGPTNMTSRFTYKVKIDSGNAPLRISLKEGESTTGSISVTYNLSNLFLEMGESTLRIVRQTDNGGYVESSRVEVDSSSTGESQLTISTTGTYFIQILSPSGNLLFTYKVIRNEPLNAAAIIAIVVAAVVLVAVIFIIIKLRKRISVK